MKTYTPIVQRCQNPPSRGLWLTLIIVAVVIACVAACRAAPGEYWERASIQAVARDYRLSKSQTELLQAIRMHERGAAGLEFGVGQNLPRHPARRWARWPEVSLKVQAQWAAGTIREHYRGPHDLERFGRRYAEDPRWAGKVRRVLRKSVS